MEAAGVEPASGSVTGEATPCSASSWFSPRRLEKRQNGGQGNPEFCFAAPSGDPERLHPHFATSAGARRVRYPDKRGYLIKQPERSCCCSQLLFFTLFYEEE